MNYIKILLVAIAFTTGSSLIAQPLISGTTTTAEYKASIPGWLVNVQEANVESIKTGKPILANFTGSDWCGWCIKLRREVFDTPEFEEWAEENVVLLELDFPRKFQLPDDIRQQNASLQQAFGVRGYPTLWIFTLQNSDQGQMSINGYGSLGYEAGGPERWTGSADKIIANGPRK